jgi:predicted anti-sigma-YlaC factor YlaD
VLRSVCGPGELKLEATNQHARHFSAELLGLHVLGDLAIFQRSRVEEHLENCGTCRNQLRRVAGVIAAFRKEGARTTPPFQVR